MGYLSSLSVVLAACLCSLPAAAQTTTQAGAEGMPVTFARPDARAGDLAGPHQPKAGSGGDGMNRAAGGPPPLPPPLQPPVPSASVGLPGDRGDGNALFYTEVGVVTGAVAGFIFGRLLKGDEFGSVEHAIDTAMGAMIGLMAGGAVDLVRAVGG